MDTIRDLLEKSGGPDYIMVWIKYFTKPFTIKEANAKSKSPFDNFISSFNYSPTPIQNVAQLLKTPQSPTELINSFANLFNLNDIPILHHLFFLHSWFESRIEVQRSNFINNNEDFFVRSFICVSFQFRNLLPTVYQGNTCTELPENCWGLISEAASIIFSFNSVEIQDAYILINYFFTSFQNLQIIFRLVSTNYIRNAIQKLGLILIPYLNLEETEFAKSLLEFLSNIFHEWTVVFKRDADLNDYSLFTSAFLNTAIDVFFLFHESQVSEIITDLSSIIQYLLTSKDLNDSNFQLITTCFRFLTHSTQFINKSPILIAVVNDLSLVAITYFSDFHVKTLPQEDPSDMNLTTCLNNFAKNSLSKKGCLILNQSIYLIFAEMRKYVTNLDDKSLVLVELATRNLQVTDEISLPEKSFSLLIALSHLKITNFEYVEALLKSIPLHIFFPYPLKYEERIQEYQSAFLHFIFLFVQNNPKYQDLMFDFLSKMYPPENFDLIVYFIPLFRAFVQVQNKRFLETQTFILISEVISPNRGRAYNVQESTIDQLIQFLVASCLFANDHSLIESILDVLIPTSALIHPRYYHFFKPVLKHEFDLVHNVQFFNAVLNYISIILTCIENNSHMYEVVCFIFESFLNGISKFPVDKNILIKSKILTLFAQTIATFKSNRLFYIFMQIIDYLDSVYPQFTLNNSPQVFEILKNAHPLDSLDKELIHIIEKYAYDTEFQTYKIYKPKAVNFLLKLVEDTVFEDEVMISLCELCSNNASSAYKLFSNNLLSELLERLSNSIFFKALTLFSIIASQYFSPIVMRDIIKLLRTTENEGLRIAVANCLLDLVSRSQKCPVSSFFNFTEEDKIESVQYDLSVPFSVAFCFRVNKKGLGTSRTLFSIQNGKKILKFTITEKNNICIEINNKNKITQFIGEQVSKQKWHTIVFILKPTSYEFVYDQSTYVKEIPPTKFDEHSIISFDESREHKFHGDIGPILFMKTEKLQTAVEQAQESFISNDLPISCILGYLPTNVSEGMISGVLKNEISISAEIVPFVSSFVDVIKFDSIFPLTLPLMLIDNGNQGCLYLRSLFGLTVSMITKDEKMEKFFRDSGGFRVFSSILKHTPNALTFDIVHDIMLIYKNVSQESKHDLVKYMILNYDVWMGKDIEFQKSLYGDILPQILSQNSELHSISAEELLMTTISSCCDEQPISTLSEENFEKIPKSESERLFFIPMRWNFFEKYFELNPSDTCFSAIFLNAFFHPDQTVRKYARETFTKTLRRCKVNIIPPLNPINLLLDELLENKAEVIEDTLTDISLVMATRKDMAKIEDFELLYSIINENNYITYMSVSYILFASNTEIYMHFFLLWLSTQKYLKEKDEIQYQNMIAYLTDRSVLCGISKHSQVYKIFAEFWNKYDFTPEKIANTLDILLEYQPSSDFTPLFTILGKEKCRLIISKLNTEYYELAFFCSFLTYDEYSDSQISLLTIDICVRTINSRPEYYIMFGTTKIHPFIAFSNIAGQIISTKPSKKDDIDQLYKSLVTIVPIDAHINYSKIVYNKYQPDLFKINFDYNIFLKELMDSHKAMVDLERESFNKIHDDFDKDIKNDKLRTSKLFTSFMRTISTDGGPWSSELCKHWKYMSKVDSTGRILFYSRNTHFTDHKNAKNKNDDNDEEIEPVKSFVLSFKKEIRKSISVFQATSRKITGFYNGYMHILDDSICFDGVYSADSFGNTRLLEKKRPFFKLISYSDITFIFRRYFLHEDCGIEVFTKNFKSYLFYFANSDTRNNFLSTVSTKIPKITLPKHHLFHQLVSKFGGIPIQNCESEELLLKSGIAKRWASGRISNYEYLYLLNVIGGRSFNDVSQYPIYPWIISDYKTNKYDINNPSFFRDLSKPIGALNQERFDSLRNDRDFVDDPTEKCLFRSNMSNPSSVCGFLVREEPFTTMHIKLQDGYFDKADRLFYSIDSAWNSCNNSNSDYRELLPQFYCNPRFLKNENKFSFGKRSTGVLIDDVELPNWASSPYDFVDKNLIALESSYTSQHLNEWIDLVFGINQRSAESEFHCFSYHDCMIGVTNEEDIELRKNHCANFGSMPTKIFKVKSPKKNIQIPLKVFDYQGIVGNTVPPPKILCLLNGCCLTEDGVFTKLSRKMHKVKFNYRFTDDMSYAISTDPLTLFVCGKNSPVVTSFPFNHPNNSTRLMHSSSNIICMSATSDRLVVCGSDCFIYLWNSLTSELISTMQIHSSPIVDVSASTELSAFASIDRSHNIFVVSLTDKHVISSFNAKVAEDVKDHKICLTQNGRIIISNRSSSKDNSILIFDICGSLINKLTYGCDVVAIRSSMLSSGNVFCIASLGSRRIECISDKTSGIERMPNEDSKKIYESFNPNFISIRSKEKTIWYGTNSGLLSRIVLCNDV